MLKRLFLVLALLVAVVQAAAVAAQPSQPTSPSVQQSETLLIRFNADLQPTDQITAIEAVGLRREQIVEELPELHIVAVELTSTDPSAADLITQLTAQPGVVYAELSQEYHLIPDVEADMPPSLQAEPTEPAINQAPAFTPNDPSINQQYALTRMQAFSAWGATQGSPNIIIAVIDSGVVPTHPDLEGQLVPGPDLIDGGDTRSDPNGHGTWVAGVAAAKTNNSLGIAGMCPNCRVMPVRAMRADGSGSTTTIANAITAAVDRGARIINLSLGGSSDSPTLRDAVNNAWNKGAFVVCAAGNAGTNQRFFPAAYENCFSVGATDSNDVRASFSNFGTWVYAAAPGQSIYTTTTDGGYRYVNGTSFSTPYVAGVAGLLASQNLTNVQIRDRLCGTADKITGTGTAWTCGRVNASRAVREAGTSQAPRRTVFLPLVAR